ncbi:unnamed protein product [Camellia sinensis]
MVWAIKQEEIHYLQVHDVKEAVHELTANANVACFSSQGTGVKIYNWSGVIKHINFNKTVKSLAMFGSKLYYGYAGYSILKKWQEVDLHKYTAATFYSGVRKILRKQTIHSLCIHNGLLFAGGTSVDGIVGKVVIGTFSTGLDIHCMAINNDLIFTATKCGIIEVWLKERVTRFASIKRQNLEMSSELVSVLVDMIFKTLCIYDDRGLRKAVDDVITKALGEVTFMKSFAATVVQVMEKQIKLQSHVGCYRLLKWSCLLLSKSQFASVSKNAFYRVAVAQASLLHIVIQGSFRERRKDHVSKNKNNISVDTMEHDRKGLDLKTGSFTLRQLKAATNNFDVANKIGESCFGSVYKLSSKSKQGNREFLNEIGMISALQHPHVVKFNGCCVEGNQLLVVYEYMENNSLACALFGLEECQLKLDWATRYKICIAIARGLAYLHEESRLKIVHRDINATNVLLDKNLNPKIFDFGLAKLDEEDNTHISTRIIGTYGYMAPRYAMREIVSGRNNTSNRRNEDSLYLLDWALELKEKGKLMELVDPKLGPDFVEKEVIMMINVATLCTNVTPTIRPTMSSVVSILEGRAVVEELVSNSTIFNHKMAVKGMMVNLQHRHEIDMNDSFLKCR